MADLSKMSLAVLPAVALLVFATGTFTYAHLLLMVALLVSATGTLTYAQTTSTDSCPRPATSNYQPDGVRDCINAAREAGSQLTRLGVSQITEFINH